MLVLNWRRAGRCRSRLAGNHHHTIRLYRVVFRRSKPRGTT